MLSNADIETLISARSVTPFNVLGLQQDALGATWLRVMLPMAETVAAIDHGSGQALATLVKRHPSGVFEGRMPRGWVGPYRLRVRWTAGTMGDYADAYAFAPELDLRRLDVIDTGDDARSFEVLGAHPVQRPYGAISVEGVRFALWAPRAERVSVVGEFNDWDGRRHPMAKRGDSGVWELFVPHVCVGDKYKFEIRSHRQSFPALKADPYARAAQYRPDTASIVAAMPDKKTLPPSRADANRRNAPISIYEVHLGSWRRSASGEFLTWDELAEVLPDYVNTLGFTHLELLPITEFPFDGSWGYQALGLYAPTARFGGPAGFTRFVAACHAKNVGVLLDWVPAHFPSDTHGLVQFDGFPLYEYADPREGFHRDWNTLIYDFGRPGVRNFLAGSALYWAERFGVDGLRVDAVASMLYRDYSRPAGEWIPNAQGGRENLEAISLFKRINETLGTECPGAVTIAEESTAFPGVSAPTYAGGLGFHYKWNMGWMHDTLEYMREDPVHRRWHHDKMTFGLSYAFSENFVLALSHDEVVHGKGSLLAKMPGDRWQQFANLRAYYGFMWGHPGKKLMFMGQEFAQPSEWNHDAALPWHTAAQLEHQGVQALVTALNTLYKTKSALHALDFSADGFDWIDSADTAQSVFAWLRRDDSGDEVIVVCNFTPVPRVAYRVGIAKHTGPWQEVLNTDDLAYGGSGVINSTPIPVDVVPAHGRPYSLCLTLPPLGTVFLSRAQCSNRGANAS